MVSAAYYVIIRPPWCIRDIIMNYYLLPLHCITHISGVRSSKLIIMSANTGVSQWLKNYNIMEAYLSILNR